MGITCAPEAPPGALACCVGLVELEIGVIVTGDAAVSAKVGAAVGVGVGAAGVGVAATGVSDGTIATGEAVDGCCGTGVPVGLQAARMKVAIRPIETNLIEMVRLFITYLIFLIRSENTEGFRILSVHCKVAHAQNPVNSSFPIDSHHAG